MNNCENDECPNRLMAAPASLDMLRGLLLLMPLLLAPVTLLGMWVYRTPSPGYRMVNVIITLVTTIAWCTAWARMIF